MTTTITRTECEVADQIVRWQDVQLDNGCFVVSERHGDRYTAVRRYVETPAPGEGGQ